MNRKHYSTEEDSVNQYNRSKWSNQVKTFSKMAVFFGLALGGIAAANATCGPGTHWDGNQGLCFPDATGTTNNLGQGQSMTQGQGQSQSAQSSAGAAAGASASGVGTGGSATGYGGSSQIGNVGNDSSTSSFRAYALALPSTLNVPQITPATAMCSLSESWGRAIGWNFVAWSGAKQTIDGLCVAERQAAAFEQTCKFRSAAAIRFWIAQKANMSPELQEVEYANPNDAIRDYDSNVGTIGQAEAEQRVRESVAIENARRRTNLSGELSRFLASANVRPYEVERDLSIEECLRPKAALPPPAPVVVAPPMILPKSKRIRQ